MFTSFITLQSNSSVKHHPQNSITRFTNVLPQPIQAHDRKVFIRLRRLVMSYKFVEVITERISHVKIHLSELEPQTVNTFYEKTLANFQFPPEDIINDEYALHDFEHAQFIELRSVPLHQLSILVTDSNNREIKLSDDSAPTILLFELSDMDYSKQFSITCQSKNLRGLELYPNNSLSRFRVRLPQEFYLENWEVAMVNMTYPPDLKHDVETNVWVEMSTNYDEGYKEKFNFDIKEYEETSQFITDVIHTINYDNFWGALVTASEKKEDDKVVGFQFAIQPDPDSFPRWNLAITVTLEFNDLFWSVFDAEKKFNKSPSLFADTRVEILGIPNINRILPSSVGMVYCDIVKPSPVGEMMAPLLQIVPLPPVKSKLYQKNMEDTRKNIGIYEPQHLIFHPISNKEFSDIEFEILQPDGQSLNLIGSDDFKTGMSFTLLFRISDKYNAMV